MTSLKIFIILTLSLISYQSAVCPPGCVHCENSRCHGCFQRKITLDYKCSEIQDPTSSLCDIYNADQMGCSWCKQGYGALAQTSGECAQINIEGCRVGSIAKGIEFCTICNGGFPESSLLKCGKFEGQIGPKENCMWGANHGGHNYCMRCKSGHTSVAGVCVPSRVEGCMFSSDVGYCQICNGWEGYFALNDDGKCVKGISSE